MKINLSERKSDDDSIRRATRRINCQELDILTPANGVVRRSERMNR